MKPTAGKKDWRDVVRPLVRKVEPAARIAERVASIAVQLQKPTPMGVIGMASAAINVVKDLTDQRQPHGWNMEMLVSREHIVEAFKAGGATVHPPPKDHNVNNIRLLLHGEEIIVVSDGSMTLPAYPSDVFLEWMCQMLDRVLPPVLVVGPGSGDYRYCCTPGKLTELQSKQGPVIAEATRNLLDGGRCILLDGRPGVGKTTMAQEIARTLRLGRVVILEPGTVGRRKEAPGELMAKSQAPASTVSGVSFALSLSLLRPGVVIIDDVDKIYLPLNDLEAIRRVAKLVILTSNNGEYDDVIDASTIRPGRVDEVFQIKPEHSCRRVPFDQLPDEVWESVRDWPIAYLNELEKRLLNRKGDLNIDDLKQRLSRKTRSGDALH